MKRSFPRRKKRKRKAQSNLPIFAEQEKPRFAPGLFSSEAWRWLALNSTVRSVVLRQENQGEVMVTCTGIIHSPRSKKP